MKSIAYTEWETPQNFYAALDSEFGFTIDVCAIKQNAKHENYFTPSHDALTQPWEGVCWMNPPYNKDIGLWVAKAWESHLQGTTVVALLQGRSTDTKWWHKYVMRSSEIRFIKDRLHFGKHGVFSRANISSIVVVFKPYCKGPPSTIAINNAGTVIEPVRQI